jgi:hypothetical protein
MEQTIGEYFKEVNLVPGVTPTDRVMAELLKTHPQIVYDEALDLVSDLNPGVTYTVKEVAEIVAKVLRPESEE